MLYERQSVSMRTAGHVYVDGSCMNKSALRIERLSKQQILGLSLGKLE